MKRSKQYPLTYEEFEKRVIELTLENNKDIDSEKFLTFIDSLKNDSGCDELEALYTDSCYRHDMYDMNAFTDENLISQPVRLLLMIY